MSRQAASVPVGSVTTWLSGGTPDRANATYWSGSIPWISAATLKRTRIYDSDQRITESAVRSGSKLAPQGATLVLVRGMALHREVRAGLAMRPVSFNQDVKALIPRPGLVPQYLTYSLHAQRARILELVSFAGSGTGVLDTGLLKRLPIWLPGSYEQEMVVDAIEDVDSAVEALERLIAKKQAIKQGMMQQLLTGKTRLPGFTAPWTWRPFGEVMIRLNAKKHQVPASSYSDVGRLPVVDQGKTAIVGYTNDLEAEFDPGPDGVVVFGDHTCITKFVGFKFAIGADGTQIVKARTGYSTRFFGYALKADPVASTGYNRHYKFLREKVLPSPPPDEQEAIVRVLREADAELSALRARLEKARGVKAGMMQELLTGRTRLPVAEAVA